MAVHMKIFIATGASGGHIYPALAVADILRRDGHEVIFTGVFKQWEELIRREGFELLAFPAGTWNVKSAKSVPASFEYMLQLISHASHLVVRHKPDRIAGFGGYGSFPIALTGWFRKVPVFIHEQNAAAGRANKFLSWFARCVMVSFPESARNFPAKKTIVTGYPLRAFPEPGPCAKCLKEFGLEPGIPTVVVCGGSQGSRALNNAMVQAAVLLKAEMDMQILHISGATDANIVKMGYERLGIRHRVFPFSHQMEKIYASADAAVIRAGAGVLHEAAHFNIPAVIIPYPYAGAHQKKNALAFIRANPGLMIEEKYLTAKRLCGDILHLLRIARTPTQLSDQGTFLKPDAAERIASIIIQGGAREKFMDDGRGRGCGAVRRGSGG